MQKLLHIKDINIIRHNWLVYLMMIPFLFTGGCNKQETASVSTLFVTSITTHSARSGGNIMSDGGSMIQSSGLLWDIQAQPTLSRYLGMTENHTGLTTFNTTITGLDPRTTYYTRAYASNEQGTSYGDEQVFTTLGQEPGIQILPITALTTFGVALNAAVNPNHLGTTVYFEYGLTNLYGNVQQARQVLIEGDTLVQVDTYIEDLQPGMTYHFRVGAENVLGITISENASFTSLPGGELTDQDGNEYRTVVIGSQEWMASNLKATRYRDGTTIASPGADDAEWASDIDGAYAWYDNNEHENKEYYGALYNWYAATHPSGLCPTGWRVPSREDFEQLMAYVDPEGIPGNNLAGMLLKSCRQEQSPAGGFCDTEEHPRWIAHDTANGTDAVGFSAMPGGYRTALGSFVHQGSQASFWTTTSTHPSLANQISLNNYEEQIRFVDSGKNQGLGIRCIKE
jgi:uncharacterized protein (TIGR02145 family)